jgi:hypothetical protein
LISKASGIYAAGLFFEENILTPEKPSFPAPAVLPLFISSIPGLDPSGFRACGAKVLFCCPAK